MSQNLRKAVRIVPSHLEELHFHRTEPPARNIIKVANVSITGVGLVRGKESWPELEETFKGRFEYQGKLFDVQLHIVHKGEQLIGCQFEGNVQDVQDLFRKHFKAEVAAAKMNQVRSELLNTSSSGTPVLFVGSDGSELYYIKGAEGISRFTLKFLGNVLDGKASADVRDDAIRFLQNIAGLDSQDRKELVDWVISGPKK